MNLKKKIIENLPRIVEPATYYAGTPDVELPLPGNVLIASRFPGKMPSTTKSSHRRFLLLLVFEGRNCEAIVDGIRYRIRPGEAFLIFPWQLHYFFPGEDFRWLYLTFEMPGTSILEPLRGKISIIPENAYKYLEILTGTYKGARKGGISYTSEIVLLSTLILNSLLTAEKTTRAKTDPGEEKIFVDKVNRYVAGNIGRKLSVGKLAKIFSLSESHFRTLYRQRMGESIGSYINKSKLLRAKSLLAASDMDIGGIAIECGFGDIYSFSRFFSKNAGESPRKFRKSVRK